MVGAAIYWNFTSHSRKYFINYLARQRLLSSKSGFWSSRPPDLIKVLGYGLHLAGFGCVLYFSIWHAVTGDGAGLLQFYPLMLGRPASRAKTLALRHPSVR
jgi:hypothetical protein